MSKAERLAAEEGFETLRAASSHYIDLTWLISLHGNDDAGILSRLKAAVDQSNQPGVVKQIWVEWLAQLWTDGVAAGFVSYVTKKHKSGDYEVATYLRVALQSSSAVAVRTAVRQIFYDVAKRTSVKPRINHEPPQYDRATVIAAARRPALGIEYDRVCAAHGGDLTGLLCHLVATNGLVSDPEHH